MGTCFKPPSFFYHKVTSTPDEQYFHSWCFHLLFNICTRSLNSLQSPTPSHSMTIFCTFFIPFHWSLPARFTRSTITCQSLVFLKSDSTVLVCHIMFTLSEPDVTFKRETLFSHSSSYVSLPIYVQFVSLLHQVTSSPIMPVFLAQYSTKLGLSNI